MTTILHSSSKVRSCHSKQSNYWFGLVAVLALLMTLCTGVSGQVERDVVSPDVEARAEDANGNTVPVSDTTDNNDTSNTSPNDDDEVQYVQFNVQLDADTTDSFLVKVHPSWAPIGAARFLELVDADFFDNVRFFRVLDNFVAQFGISGDPVVAAAYDSDVLVDDPVVVSNTEGTFSFATAGPGTRTTQIFVSFQDNEFLDDSGFAPFAQLASPEDLQVVQQLYSGYGEGAPGGNGPNQQLITQHGNEYLEADFPLLSYITSVERIEAPPSAAEDEDGGQAAAVSDSSTAAGDNSITDATDEEPTTTTVPVNTDSDANSATTSSADRLFLESKLLLALSAVVAVIL